MAKQTKTIDNVTYVLHPVAKDKKKLGVVPVVEIRGSSIDDVCAEFRMIVENKVHSLDASDIAKHFHAGLAIALQAQVREMASPDKITQADVDREINKMDATELASYTGRFAALQAEGKRRAVDAKADGASTTDENYMWNEVL